MDDREFDAALRAAQARAKAIFAQAHGFQQSQVEARLRGAGVGERTLDAEALVGVLRVQGGVTLAARSGTATPADNAGTRAPVMQDALVREIRLQIDSPPSGGPLYVLVRCDGRPLTAAPVAILDGSDRGFTSRIDDPNVFAGEWLTFDITQVGPTTPGGRVYVAVKTDVDVRRGGAAP